MEIPLRKKPVTRRTAHAIRSHAIIRTTSPCTRARVSLTRPKLRKRASGKACYISKYAFPSILNGYVLATAIAANGRAPKRDNTKQSTLFGLPAVSAPDKTAKRGRNKGGAAPSEDVRAPEPDTSESQDVEMVESQNTEDLASGSTAVDSQHESQATEVVTPVEVRLFHVLHVEVTQSNAQEGHSPEPFDWPQTPPSMGQNLPDEISAS